MRAALLIAILAGACRPVVPPSPDAADSSPAASADAAPTPGPEAGPPLEGSPGPVSDCAAACAALAAAGCTSQTQGDCPTTLSKLDADRLRRNPDTGRHLSCVDIARVKTPADAHALGLPCP